MGKKTFLYREKGNERDTFPKAPLSMGTQLQHIPGRPRARKQTLPPPPSTSDLSRPPRIPLLPVCKWGRDGRDGTSPSTNEQTHIRGLVMSHTKGKWINHKTPRKSSEGFALNRSRVQDAAVDERRESSFVYAYINIKHMDSEKHQCLLHLHICMSMTGGGGTYDW